MRTRVFAIIHEKGKFLLIRESNLKFKNQWYLPGGALEDHEDIISGLRREVKEESGYEAGVNGICFMKYVDRPISRKGLYIYCSARTLSGNVKTIADENSMEAGWFTLAEILKLEMRGNLAEMLQMLSDDMPLLPTQHVQLNVTS